MEKLQNEERTFFFFAFHFSKPLKFVLGLPKWKFSTGKKHFTAGKKLRKNDFAPSEQFSCYAPEGDPRRPVILPHVMALSATWSPYWGYSDPCQLHTWKQMQTKCPHDIGLMYDLLYTPIAFDERVTFGFNAPGHCLVRVRLLHCMRVQLRNGITQAYAQIMQHTHTHTHKAVTGRIEAKMLLSHRRQSNYSWQCGYLHMF